MVEPIVVPRSSHNLSRRDVDHDALKVLYRLREANYVAYLVGGSVRDLLLGRTPKDFDIGTSAHPYQVKRLFRNCWIIGRRFRLAHVKFGNKIIEVATFRRQVTAAEDEAALDATEELAEAPEVAELQEHHRRDLLIQRDNSFGTPEEDAFRRDFTVNALFYDIATFSIIDYVGGLEDLKKRVVRCIGDPDERFREDPVRMLRAVALAGRLDFTVDPPIEDSIRRHRGEIARAAPARLLEELYKILRAGAAERTFRALADVGLLAPISQELQSASGEPLWKSLARLDTFRAPFTSIPERLTNPILLGTLLLPLGFDLGGPMPDVRAGGADEADDNRGNQAPGIEPGDEGQRRRRHPRLHPPPRTNLGVLPIPRREVERLHQLLALQRRLRDANISPRALTALTHRHAFADALTWLEVHGGVPHLVSEWRARSASAAAEGGGEAMPPHRRRRRRRRRFPGPLQPQ